MKSTRTLGYALLAAFGVAGCGATGLTSNDPDLPPGVPANANRIAWRQLNELTTPVSNLTEARRVVIRTEEEWTAFWTEFQGSVVPMPPPPAIDFNRQMVLAATMGHRPTGGYAIQFKEVFGSGQELFPVVLQTSPGAGCLVTQVITAPAVAAVVDRADMEITFVEESRTTDCR